MAWLGAFGRLSMEGRHELSSQGCFWWLPKSSSTPPPDRRHPSPVVPRGPIRSGAEPVGQVRTCWGWGNSLQLVRLDQSAGSPQGLQDRCFLACEWLARVGAVPRLHDRDPATGREGQVRGRDGGTATASGVVNGVVLSISDCPQEGVEID